MKQDLIGNDERRKTIPSNGTNQIPGRLRGVGRWIALPVSDTVGSLALRWIR